MGRNILLKNKQTTTKMSFFTSLPTFNVFDDFAPARRQNTRCCNDPYCSNNYSRNNVRKAQPQEEILSTRCSTALSETLEATSTIHHSMITDSNPNSSMMNMIPTIQTEESKLPENQELLKQELLKKLLTNIAMSQKKIYKDQLTFQTRTKKILTQ